MDKLEREIDVSIVTGTYNRLLYLKRMVDSVRKSVGGLSYEIIAVDGGSTDGTLEYCRSEADIRLIEQGELLGAIEAFNAGARAARGYYVVLLNDDIEVLGDTIRRAYNFMQRRPHVGQVAFMNIVKGTADRHRRPFARAFGFLYGQCCMTPKHLGDMVGWWGDEGMKTYGGDSRLSLALWELGYPTVPLDGCAIIDYVVEDELRDANNSDMLGEGLAHPDSKRFWEVWKDRLPEPQDIVPASLPPVLAHAARGSLKTLQFKAMMRAGDKPRKALINALAEFGPAKIVCHPSLNSREQRDDWQATVMESVDKFRPDLVLFQSQREHKATRVETIEHLQERYPKTYFVNWDGDTHYPITDWHIRIAKAVDLQLVVSPSLFDVYRKGGAYVGYWPIGIEREYLVDRPRGPFMFDAVFLGALYGQGIFPEAEERKDAVLALCKENIDFGLFGYGWHAVGLEAGQTSEKHAQSSEIYAKSKMSLSISQSSELWGYTSDRLYNICASGCAALVQTFAGMEEHGYVDGETCIAWSSTDEMIEKMHYYLDHDEEREEIAAAGKRMTRERHTWRKRLDGLFAMIGGITYG